MRVNEFDNAFTTGSLGSMLMQQLQRQMREVGLERYRMIVKISTFEAVSNDSDGEAFQFTIDLQSDKGGGDGAVDKMRVLQERIARVATVPLPDNSPNPYSPDVPGYGGIAVPYTAHLFPGEEHGSISTDGKIYIAFSGAEQWQDIYFALCALVTIRKFFAKEEPSVCLKLDLEELHQHAPIKFWLDLMDINEV